MTIPAKSPNDPASPWFDNNPASWILPTWWQRWPAVVATRTAQGMQLDCDDRPVPFTLDNPVLTEFLRWLVSDFKPASRGYVERADLVSHALTLVGPLAPLATLTYVAHWYGIGQRVSVPSVGTSIRAEDMFFELELLREGVLATHALLGTSTERGLELAHSLKRIALLHDTVSTDREVLLVDSILIARWASEEEKCGGAPGTVGFLVEWLSYMATRWPTRLFVHPQLGRQVVPIPEAPAHIVWLTLARTVNAIRLAFPGAAEVHFCANCGELIYSSKPRLSGKRWFCDPAPGTKRSVCQNRFFSAQGKARARKSKPQGAT